MRKLKLFSILVAVVMVLAAFSAEADMITGSVSFSGGYNTDTGNLGTANAFISFSGVKVTDTGAGTYDFAPLVAGTTLTMPGFEFDPFTPPKNLWTATVGGIKFSFDMTTVEIYTQDSTQLTLRGIGTASIQGFDNTPGAWILTANELGQTLSFSASTSTIPEPATMLLFGSGLLGMAGVIRRRFRK